MWSGRDGAVSKDARCHADGPSLIPQTYVVEGESQLLHVQHMCVHSMHVPEHIHAHTHTYASKKRARGSKCVSLREHLGEGSFHLVYYLECIFFHLPEFRKGHRSLLMSTDFIGWPTMMKPPSLRTGKRQEPTPPVIAHKGSAGLLRGTEVSGSTL